MLHLKFLNLIPIKSAHSHSQFYSTRCIRIQFLEIRINDPLLRYFDKVAAALDEVAFTLQRTVVDLLDELDGESYAGRVGGRGANGGCLRVLGPGGESLHFGFVGEGAGFVGGGVGAAEYGEHGDGGSSVRRDGMR